MHKLTHQNTSPLDAPRKYMLKLNTFVNTQFRPNK